MMRVEDIEIVGQDVACNILEKIKTLNIRGRSILLYGPKGVGKFTSALILAHKLIGHKNVLFANHPDLFIYRYDDWKTKLLLFQKQLQWGNISEVRLKIFAGTVLFHYLLEEAISGKIEEEEEEESSRKRKKKKVGISDKIQIVSDYILSTKPLSTNKLQEILGYLEDFIKPLEKRKAIPIEVVRKMIAFHMEKPYGNIKISIIGDIDKMTLESANALLKLTEEPPEDALIILTTTNLDAVLPTIRSRCIIIKFQQIQQEQIKNILTGQLFVPEKIAEKGIPLSEGSVYKAILSIVYDLEDTSNEILNRFLKESFSLPQSTNIFDLVKSLKEDDVLIEAILTKLMELLRYFALLRINYYYQEDVKEFFDKFSIKLDEDVKKELIKLSKYVKFNDIKQLNQEVERVYRGIKQTNWIPHLNFLQLATSFYYTFAKKYVKEEIDLGSEVD